ncbi:MAG: enoyl-CoA hydratase/isomerase family protein [Smithellaceae bacterium]
MALIEWKKVERTALVTMTNNQNKMDLHFASEMLRIFDEVLADESLKALVLTSSDAKFFSMGVHVDWLMERLRENDTASAKKFLFDMQEVFKKILLMPLPVIAAINGHAFGNGSIICCACDFRFMRSDRGYFGFPEVDINIPFLPSMLLWIPRVIPHALFHNMALTGRQVNANELAKHGVIEKACKDSQELIDEALRFAGTFDKGRKIFGELKRRMNQHIIHIMETEDRPLLDSLALFVKE